MSEMQKTPSPAELAAASGDGLVGDAIGIDVEHYMHLLNAEREWRSRNRDVWRKVEDFAVGEARQRRRFSIQTIIERLRWQDNVDADGRKLRIPNAYGAIWARVLMAEHPGMEQFITHGRSTFDKLDVVWR